MIVRSILLLGCLLCAGCASSPVRRSDALPAKGIVIYGDTQNNRVHRRIVQAILRTGPAAVFHAGDLTDDGTSERQWKTFNTTTKELRAAVPYYPAPGNHEQHARRYFDNFELPHNEQWYRVTVEGIRFVVLDSESPLDPASGQYRWLEDELRAGGRGLTVVVLHRPLFSSSDDGGSRELRRWLVPLFERYAVAAVFSGHHHNYERSLVNGVYYIVTGGGGGRLDADKGLNPQRRVFEKRYHFCSIQPGGATAKVTVYGLDLDIIDQCTLPARE